MHQEKLETYRDLENLVGIDHFSPLPLLPVLYEVSELLFLIAPDVLKLNAVMVDLEDFRLTVPDLAAAAYADNRRPHTLGTVVVYEETIIKEALRPGETRQTLSMRVLS